MKQGKVAAARVAYNNVRLIAEYPSWPYSPARGPVTADPDAKAALYMTPTRTTIRRRRRGSGSPLPVCHATTADE